MTLSASGAAPATDPFMAMFAVPAAVAPEAAPDPLALFRAAFETALSSTEVATEPAEEPRVEEKSDEEEAPEAPAAAVAVPAAPVAVKPFVFALPIRLETHVPENVSSVEPSESAPAAGIRREVPTAAIEPPEPPAVAPKEIETPEAFALRLRDAAAVELPDTEPQATQTVDAAAPRDAQARDGESMSQERNQSEARSESPEPAPVLRAAPETRAVADAPVRFVSEPTAPVSKPPAPVETPIQATAARAFEPVEAPREPATDPGPPRLALRVGGTDRASETLQRDLTSPATRPAVDVIVEQRRGDVHFSVRSADPHLTQDLRGSLGELTGRLEQSGYRAETTTPVETLRAAEPSAVRSSDSRFQEDSGERGRGWTGQDSRDSQRDGNRRQGEERPRWLTELEESFFGNGANRATKGNRR